jgi:WD40 repeat protein
MGGISFRDPSDNTIRIWNAETGSAVGKPLYGHTDHGQLLILPMGGISLCLVTIPFGSGTPTGSAVGKPLEGHTDSVWSVAYSPNGRNIISGSTDDSNLESETGSAVEPLKGNWLVWSVAYSPMGGISSLDLVCTVGYGTPGSAEGHTHAVMSVAYSPDGRHIISGCLDKTIRIWNAETGSAVGHPLEGHTHAVVSVAYSPDGRHIISGCLDKTIRIWNAETGLQSASLWRGTLALCGQLLTLPMGGISSLGLMIRQFESGMQRLGLRLAGL